MSENHSTQIRWTHLPGTVGRTWNPVRGCELESPGCQNCYAAEIAVRFGTTPTFEAFAKRLPNGRAVFTGKVVPMEHKLHEPLSWKKPSTIFTCSMADLFHPDVPFSFLDRVFDVMEQASRHRFLILTKRPKRMQEYMYRRESWGRRAGTIYEGTSDVAAMSKSAPANIWLGTSIEDQKRAYERIPILLDTPAAIRFLSVEPMLESVDLTRWLWRTAPDPGPTHWFEPIGQLHWVICGGESGKMRRPFDMDWARSLRDQCAEAGVAFYFKQAGGRRSEEHPHIDGWKSEQWPTISLDQQQPTYYGSCEGEQLAPEGLVGEAVAV